MKRKEFLKKSVFAGFMGTLIPGLLKAEESTYDRLKQNIGFNHLPNIENKRMNRIIHRAETRGHANHGWLDTHHTFSFANYYNPERMHFGVLRVLNDDRVAAGRGFGKHPHDNMEIVSIPLEGDLEHEDSMGNKSVIKEGDVQVMSAGTGIQHSEFNKNADQEVKFLQIWLFPNQKNVKPRYDQISIAELKKPNALYQILSPKQDDQGVWIYQNAWFHMGDYSTETTETYSLKMHENGVYAFVLKGEVEIEGEALKARDGMGLWEIKEMNIKAQKNSQLLVMEIPMNI